MVKVLVLQADHAGCGFYRAVEPARVVREAGLADVVVDDGLDVEYHNDTLAVVRTDADVVVFQRPLQAHLLDALRVLKRQGVKVVVELDDDIERITPSNAAYHYVHPKFSPDENWQHLRDCCREADAVVVSTPALMRYAPQGRGTVVRNTIPRSTLEIQHVGGKGVGWSGTMRSHRDDLHVVGGSLQDVQMHIIGERDGVAEELRLTTAPTETGWMDSVPAYHTHLATLDVGIAPLAENAFNRAKSYIKVLEYSALGIPWIASPLDEYVLFQKMTGLGFLAKKPRDWRRHVESLMSDDDLRAEIGASLREKVRERHVLEDSAQEWYDAWTLPLR